jgi:ketosteroid isomerase-like protein
MSQENVEIVRSIYAAWAKGDFSSVEWADVDIEFGMPGEAPCRGVEAMGRRWGDFLKSWEGVATVPEAFRDEGDRVLVLHEFRGQGKRSGIPAADFSGACVFTLKEGKVVRLRLYAHRSEALDAVGLRE